MPAHSLPFRAVLNRTPKSLTCAIFIRI
jgi:hypothetical protein